MVQIEWEQFAPDVEAWWRKTPESEGYGWPLRVIRLRERILAMSQLTPMGLYSELNMVL